MKACRADACQQGRAACPCPDSCRVIADDDGEWIPVTGAEIWAALGWPLTAVAGVVAGLLIAFYR